MMEGIVGKNEAEEWREGWEVREEEGTECDRVVEAVVAARRTLMELGGWEYLVKWKERGAETWETSEMTKSVY